MIVEYLRYSVDEAHQAAFLADYQAAMEPLMTSPFATAFELCQCVEDPSQFIIRIEWTSAEDHLQGFRPSDPFKAFFAHIQPYLSDIKEMRHYERRVVS